MRDTRLDEADELESKAQKLRKEAALDIATQIYLALAETKKMFKDLPPLSYNSYYCKEDIEDKLEDILINLCEGYKIKNVK